MPSKVIFLAVFLFFTGSADTNHSEKAGFTQKTEDSLDRDFERHRYKRALFGHEHDYFRQYYKDINRLNDYCDVRNNGRISYSGWKQLGSTSYTSAVNDSTKYYASQAKKGFNVNYQINKIRAIIRHRNETAFKPRIKKIVQLNKIVYKQVVGPDEGHSHVINLWVKGLKQIENGVKMAKYKSHAYGRKKRGIPFFLAALGIAGWAKLKIALGLGGTAVAAASSAYAGILLQNNLRRQTFSRDVSSGSAYGRSRSTSTVRRTSTIGNSRRMLCPFLFIKLSQNWLKLAFTSARTIKIDASISPLATPKQFEQFIQAASVSTNKMKRIDFIQKNCLNCGLFEIFCTCSEIHSQPAFEFEKLFLIK
ncbi:uncharacterized protein LOC133198047 [Saccostrea echinata]|uniref:uncharacterized protein LOC133198047 n=1 Tax=Saccostrea echinata TaxID=191078 RepID=UPI002A83C1A9|nr:uncharacterized protein LOC133198047 [Saccostrea echinata]